MSDRDPSRDEELLSELAELLRPADPGPDPERVEALRRAVAAKRDGVAPTPAASDPRDGPAPATRAPRRRFGLGLGSAGIRPALALAAVAIALAIGFGAGDLVGGGDGDGEPALSGTVEYDGPIGLGGASGQLTVTMTGIGRVVQLDTADLPILPKGEYYEVWFIGPGDTRSDPNRIAAGTFHPDPDGRSDVTFAAAVDPKLYPVVSVTAEPGNGNPLAAGQEVLRQRIG